MTLDCHPNHFLEYVRTVQLNKLRVMPRLDCVVEAVLDLAGTLRA
jgi:hypothetical protein